MPTLENAVLSITQHGDVVLPAGSRLRERRIADFELVWIVDGCPEWSYAGETRPAPVGSVLLIQPGVPHAFDWGGGRCCQHRYIHFEIEEAGGLEPPPRSWPRQIRLAPDACALACFREAVARAGNPSPAARALAVNALRQVLLTVALGVDEEPVLCEPGLPPALLRLLRSLDGEWRRGRVTALDLDELARRAGVSRSQLCRLFRQHLGLAPSECLRRMRLLWAAALLLHTSDPLPSIAVRTGFGDVPGFTRRFADLLGQTPGAFRRRPQRHSLHLVRPVSGTGDEIGMAAALLRRVRDSASG